MQQFTIHDAQRLLHGLGVPPIGNASAMRGYAARLDQMADSVSAVTLILDKSTIVPNVAGPGADRWAGHARETVSQSSQLARQIHDVAASVRGAAARLEQDQHHWTRGFHSLAIPGTLAKQALHMLGWRMP